MARVFTLGKPSVRKRYIVLVLFDRFYKSLKVPIELSGDCYCNLSVPIPNEQISDRAGKNSTLHNIRFDINRS